MCCVHPWVHLCIGKKTSKTLWMIDFMKKRAFIFQVFATKKLIFHQIFHELFLKYAHILNNLQENMCCKTRISHFFSNFCLVKIASIHQVWNKHRQWHTQLFWGSATTIECKRAQLDTFSMSSKFSIYFKIFQFI